jgi:hypothetical protein
MRIVSPLISIVLYPNLRQRVMAHGFFNHTHRFVRCPNTALRDVIRAHSPLRGSIRQVLASGVDPHTVMAWHRESHNAVSSILPIGGILGYPVGVGTVAILDRVVSVLYKLER